ncbi:MAG TPA: TonB-dependent receptor [Pyrinomonadaceae bacterium]|jgi:outer membrane receptor protein involved in Fe transport|nr:TonB-dependent receptor [Pyrinomonadaceae bacterium]
MPKNLPHVLARLAVLCLCLTLSPFNASAQSQATSGDIDGRVLDPNGAVVKGANVTARNNATGLERSATTDDEGSFRIILLPPGTYSVSAAAAGFTTREVADVQVTVGSRTTLDIPLAVGGARADVTVTGEAPVVETARTSVSTTINERAIQNLPINGRNFQDFATLSPGVIRDPRGGDLSVGGQRGTLNSLQVDGVDNNNTFFGQALGRGGVRPPYQFSEESVQEFQVNQNGFSAEFGRAGGAVINVVTKSGTNTFHGGLFEYLRDESLNANDPGIKAAQSRRGLPNKRAASRINQFGGRVGGPIKKDRAFFFFSYDGQRSDIPQVLDVPNFSTAPAAAQTALLPRLETYQVGRDQNVFLGKSDISLNSANQLTLRYNHQGFTGQNNENNGPLSAEEHSGDSLVTSDTFSGSLASTLTQRVVNEFRFQLARDKEPGQANSDQPEAVINTNGGNFNIGRNNFSPRETTIKRVQFIDNVSYALGRSSYKAGLDFNFDRVLNFFPGLFNGSYTFSNIADPLAPGTTLNGYQAFARNLPVSYTQNFAGPNTTGATTEPNLSEYAFYVQDDVRVTPKLTLNLGVRYDYESLACPPVTNPDPLLLGNGVNTGNCPKDKNNVGPRAGFSYAPDERTVIRGGFGLFYGRTPAIILGTAHSQNGINVTGVTLSASQLNTLGLRYPNVLTAPPAIGGSNPSLFFFAPDYEHPYVEQGRLGVEREVWRNLSLSATYLFYRGVHLTRTRDINLSAPVARNVTGPDGVVYTFQQFPSARPISRASGVSYSRINVFESAARSLYNGLALQATQRFTRGFQFIAAYTYSKAEDDRPDQTTVVVIADDAKIVQNQINPSLDYARSDTDLRHRFVFSPVYEIGRIKWSDNPVARALFSHYTLSGIVQMQSGSPYSALVANDPNSDGNRANDRLPGSVRNQFTTPAVYQFDARVTRNIPFNESVRLRLILEAFNIFNRANVVTANNIYFNFATTGGVPTLAAPQFVTAFGTPRTFSSPASGTTTFATPRQLQLAVKFDF